MKAPVDSRQSIVNNGARCYDWRLTLAPGDFVPILVIAP